MPLSRRAAKSIAQRAMVISAAKAINLDTSNVGCGSFRSCPISDQCASELFMQAAGFGKLGSEPSCGAAEQHPVRGHLDVGF